MEKEAMPQLSHRVETFTDSVIRSRAIHNPLILPEYGFDLQLIENGFKERAKTIGAIRRLALQYELT